MKYEITKETKEVNGVTLHRIRATMDFSIADFKPSRIFDVNELNKIKAGTLGGWIEKESNLSQYGLTWIADEACVFGDARITDDAVVYGNAKVYGNSTVFSSARIYGKADVRDAYIHGNAHILDDVKIMGQAEVRDNAVVRGYSHLGGGIVVSGNACLNAFHNEGSTRNFFFNTVISGDAYITIPCECLTIGPIVCSTESLDCLKGRYLTFCLTTKEELQLTISDGHATDRTYLIDDLEHLRSELKEREPHDFLESIDLVVSAAAYAKSYFNWEIAAKNTAFEKYALKDDA